MLTTYTSATRYGSADCGSTKPGILIPVIEVLGTLCSVGLPTSDGELIAVGGWLTGRIWVELTFARGVSSTGGVGRWLIRDELVCNLGDGGVK